MQERFRLLGLGAGVVAFRRDPFRLGPDRLAVAAPVERKGPARQGFAGIPLALPVVQEPAGRKAIAQAPDQPVGERPLGRADRGRVPFLQLEVVDRNEGGFAAHGQATSPARIAASI